MKPTALILLALCCACGQNLDTDLPVEDQREGRTTNEEGVNPLNPRENQGEAPREVTPPDEEEPVENPPEEPETPEGDTTFLTNQSCTEWTDCGPYFENENSGAECVNQQCVCDPNNEYATNCDNIGGYFIDEECFCVVGSSSPPPESSDENCYQHWVEEECDDDRIWVDTSRWERECYTQGGVEYCDDVYRESGYWDGDQNCNEGYWVEHC